MKKLLLLPLCALIACGTNEKKEGAEGSPEKEKKVKEEVEESPQVSWEDLEPADFLGAKMGYVTEEGGTNYFGETYWDVAYAFNEGIARVAQRDEKYTKKFGYIDDKGKQLIDYTFTDAGDFNNGLAIVQFEKGGKYGYINTKGALVLDTIYENKFDFSHGLALICNEKHQDNISYVYGNPKYGFINTQGDTVLEMKYGYAHSFSEGTAAVLDGKLGQNKFGFIDTTGTWVINPQYNTAYPFRNGVSAVYKANHKLGFINADGSDLIPAEYDEFNYFYNHSMSDYFSQNDIRYTTEQGYFMVKKGDKYGLINKNNEPVLDFIYDKLDIPEGDLVVVSKVKSKEGYRINYVQGVYNLKSGKEIVPVKYDYIYIPKGKYFDGWVNIENKSDPQSYTHDLKGIANVETGAIIEPMYEDVADFSEGLVAVKKDGKWGYVNDKNEMVIDFKYDYHDKFTEGRAYVKLGDDYIYIDKKGNKLKEE